ncbi:phytoene desaturase [Treponema sp. OMZ 840]|uniref:phytoene desaturase family protein n=1 Tax=Treponema sp. OMZ 840 TaxID=244313 RepID=UPI003D8C0930
MKKVIVIGAGMGGLSAAIRLQHAGYEVEIYEKEKVSGGKMHPIHEDGHRFDVGPTIVMMPSVYREVFELAGKNPDDYIPMTRLDPMYEVYFKQSSQGSCEKAPPRHYKVNNNLVDLMNMAEAKGTENSAGLLSYLSEIYKRYLVAVKHFISRPFRKATDMYNPYTLYQALKLKTFDSADKMMASFIPDADLHSMFSFQTLYIGVSPKKGPSLYNIIPMIELFYGIWFIKGGMYTMAEQMAKLFKELGGKIHYNSPVEKILIENSKVKGVRVKGKTVEAPYVISDADFPYTMSELIDDEKTRGTYTAEKIKNMDYSCSCLVFYWAVKKPHKDLSVHNFVISEDLDDNLSSIFTGDLLKDPSIYLHVPSNADPDTAPKGKASFYLLIPVSELKTVKYEWDAKTVDYYREKALESLKSVPGLENLKKEIVSEHVFTPNDFKNRFNAHYGATFGLQPTLRQSNHLRPQSKAKHCEGLYFTGSSTHPGAGVPIAIEGGKICASELRKDNPDDRGKN